MLGAVRPSGSGCVSVAKTLRVSACEVQKGSSSSSNSRQQMLAKNVVFLRFQKTGNSVVFQRFEFCPLKL